LYSLKIKKSITRPIFTIVNTKPDRYSINLFVNLKIYNIKYNKIYSITALDIAPRNDKIKLREVYEVLYCKNIINNILVNNKFTLKNSEKFIFFKNCPYELYI